MEGLRREVNEWKQAERLLMEQTSLLERVARGEVAGTLFCNRRGGPAMRACVLLLDDNRKCFSEVFAPRFPKFAGRETEGRDEESRCGHLAHQKKAAVERKQLFPIRDFPSGGDSSFNLYSSL